MRRTEGRQEELNQNALNLHDEGKCETLRTRYA
ncbi:hypothetical protein GcM3_177013 [Golovinomyces cichoracearum]|uniref:Uncharacterized protein n=1 Tax=Golovinomyces cichoracearum TaxID=62708 RepID=A0A420HP43_9PEZI|nr:hypothetical protein GcM3_177013 [Golovinomyces cichoracearum]